MNTSEKQNPIFPIGEKVPADYFTGAIWVKMLVPNDPALNCQIIGIATGRTNFNRY
jgi:hypothetical protein